MSDTKWLIRQGFKLCDTTPAGFSLLHLSFKENAPLPNFNEQTKRGEAPDKEGYVAYYSNRCPFTDYHVTVSLAQTAAKRNISVKVIKLETMLQAQSAPTPATIFSLFYNGKFVTTDLSICMENRFDKIFTNIE